MTIRGIGKKLEYITIVYAVITIALNYLLYPIFELNFIPYKYLVIIGITLIIAGIPLNIVSTLRIVKGYKQGILLTEGIYSFVRHPLYASYILLIVPGIAVLFRSWVVMTVPIVMYIVFRILIREEEEFLEGKFGEEYTAYKKRVNGIFPRIF